ncbi:hypothetical protein B0H21DRAFT_820150 [Amylocystis lapponica]|nr:hypothetical protein B0H21DRAFT_820150 [Amylocystis lapponica]
MKMQSLAVETITVILDGLDLRDLLVCRQVCRLLADIVDNVEYLQYKIALIIHGMQDGPPSHLSTACRYAKLRQFQICFQVPESRLNSSAMSYASPPGRLLFIQLPSRIRGVYEVRWTLDFGLFGFPVQSYALDPAQDLLLAAVINRDHMASAEIHVRSLSTGAVHPCAATPKLLAAAYRHNDQVESLSIHDDTVAWMVVFEDNWDESSTVQLWNWKTGDMVLSLHGQYPDEYPRSLYILDAQHLILSYPHRLLIFHFSIDATQVLQPGGQDYICCMFLPETTDDGSVDNDTAVLEYSPATSGCRPGIPFKDATPDPLITVRLRTTGQEFEKSFIFLLTSTVLSCVRKAADDAAAVHSAWSAWGSTGARMVIVPLWPMLVRECSIFGSKALVVSLDSGTLMRPGPLHIHLLDFNVLSTRHEAQGFVSDVELTPETSSVAAPWTIERGRFKNVITTSLPCHESKWDLRLAHGYLTGVELFEDGFVVKACPPISSRLDTDPDIMRSVLESRP